MTAPIMRDSQSILYNTWNWGFRPVNGAIGHMANRSAAEEFNTCMDAVLAHVPEGRLRIALQIVAASLGAGNLEDLEHELGKLPEQLALKKTFGFDRLARQIVAVGRQLIALDLDRTTPLRILGIGWPTITVLFAAKSLGHDAIVSCTAHGENDRLLRLYDVPRHEPLAPGDLPEGPFDLIISPGTLRLGTKRGWAGFAQSLAMKLSDDGRVFVTMSRRPYPKVAYHPDVAISNLARLGARVSSKDYFVLLDKALIDELADAEGNAAAPGVEQLGAPFASNDEYSAESDGRMDAGTVARPETPPSRRPRYKIADELPKEPDISAWVTARRNTSRKSLWKIAAVLVCSIGIWMTTLAARSLGR